MITPVSQVNVNKVPFRAEQPVKNEEPKAVETKDNKMLYAGLAGLAVLGAAGIYIATRGKSAKPQIKHPENLKEMFLNTFKQYGKFEKGKALFNGKAYSGTITTLKSKLTYKDGNLVKSELSNGIVKHFSYKGDKITQITILHPKYEKTLIRHDDRSIKIIKSYCEKSNNMHYTNDGKVSVDEITLISPDKKVSRTKKERFHMRNHNYKKGLEISLERITDLNTGKVVVKEYMPSYVIGSSNGYRKHINVDGKKVTVYYDSKGNLCSTSSHHAEYNPKTGVVTKQFYEVKNGELVPTNKFRQIDKETRATVTYTVDENGQKCPTYFTDELHGNCQIESPEKIKSVIAERGLGLKFDI